MVLDWNGRILVRGSARETIAGIDIAVACGYRREAEVMEERDRLDHIVAAMWRLSRRRK